MKVLRKSMLRIGLLVGLLVLAAAIGLACAQPTQVRVNNGVIETSEDGDDWTPVAGGNIGAGGGLSEGDVNNLINAQVTLLTPVITGLQETITELSAQVANLDGSAGSPTVDVYDAANNRLGVIERVNFGNGGITYIRVAAYGFDSGETVSFLIGTTLIGTATASSTGAALFEDVELSTNFDATGEGEDGAASYTVSAVGGSSNTTAIGGFIIEDKIPN